MLRKIVEHKSPKITEFGTRKRYYNRLRKLKEAFLIKRTAKAYETTSLGCVLYEVLQKAETVHSLSWRLRAIDAINDRIPGQQRHEIIKMLIPDENIQRILIAKC